MTKLSDCGIDNKIRSLDHFCGIYALENLCAIKIISYPVAFLVKIESNWISVIITKTDIEIMDSAGYFSNKPIPVEFCDFLSLHLFDKNFYITPQLHLSSSSYSENFSVAFIFIRILTGITLKELCDIFSNNFDINLKIVYNISKTISNLDSS